MRIFHINVLLLCLSATVVMGRDWGRDSRRIGEDGERSTFMVIRNEGGGHGGGGHEGGSHGGGGHGSNGHEGGGHDGGGNGGGDHSGGGHGSGGGHESGGGHSSGGGHESGGLASGGHETGAGHDGEHGGGHAGGDLEHHGSEHNGDHDGGHHHHTPSTPLEVFKAASGFAIMLACGTVLLGTTILAIFSGPPFGLPTGRSFESYNIAEMILTTIDEAYELYNM